IGVAAVVIIVAMGTGMSRSIEKSLAGDQNNVQVYFTPYIPVEGAGTTGIFGSIGGGEMSMEEEPDLTDSMLKGLLEIDGLSGYYISSSSTSTVAAGNTKADNVFITGVSQPYFDIKALEIL
ncbi:ABC transporter permease, partial [Streptococcus suis]|uniref:ABC transporter permease n=1 Tax=Streptococcus suis TaxID=1307 RepID=UPI00137AC307